MRQSPRGDFVVNYPTSLAIRPALAAESADGSSGGYGGVTMVEPADLRLTRIPLNHGAGQMPALGFGTLIPDPAVTITATRDALEAGFRHFDCAERYGNEREVGSALQAGLAAGGIRREEIFV